MANKPHVPIVKLLIRGLAAGYLNAGHIYGGLYLHSSVTKYEDSVSVSRIKSCKGLRVGNVGYDLSGDATKFWGF